MKNIVVILLCVVLIAVAGYKVMRNNQSARQTSSSQISQSPSENIPTQSNATNSMPQITVVAENLDTPWALVFLPADSTSTADGRMLITERNGQVRMVDKNGTLLENPIATVKTVKEIGEGGLLGITLHPDFATNNYVYLYYTYASTNDNTLNRVVRMTFNNNALTDEKTIVDRIPGASNHNGGRIKFGPDRLLYIGTGDAQNPSQAQNPSTLGGKILRVTDEGKPAPGNASGNSIYSYGHRNVQGLAWNGTGQLWATEHGRSGLQSGFDELNLIENGKNYGWPEIEGDETKIRMETPKKNSGDTTTWAPSGADFIDNRLFFSGLRGQTLYEAIINGDTVTEVKEYFTGQFGRIREVIKGPDGMLYISTSNNDGRGIPKDGDDKIIRINPNKL